MVRKVIGSNLPKSLRDGLVAEYLFNGNANDTSGNGNDGTVNGATLTTDRNGNANSAYLFDGVNDYINIGDNLDIVTTGYSISAWINTNNINNRQDVINKQSQLSPFNGFALRLNQPINGNIIFFCQNNVAGNRNAITTLTNTIPLSTLVHVAFTCSDILDAGTYEIYLNNINQSLSVLENTLASIPDTSVDFTIGSTSNNTLNFDGKIDDIRIYNRALTPDEITALYQEKLGKLINYSEPKKFHYLPPTNYTDPNLVLAINKNSILGKEVIDLSGNGNNSTNTTNQPIKNAIKLNSSINFGNIGNVRTVAFRLKRTGDIPILESGSGSGYINIATDTLSYSEFDTAYVNGVNTDTVPEGVESSIIVTSTTDVSISNLSLNKNGVTVGNWELLNFKISTDIWSLQQIKDYHNKFASQLSYKETFEDYPIGETRPKGWIPTTGKAEIKESDGTDGLPIGKKFYEWTTSGIIYRGSDKAYGIWYFGGVLDSGFPNLYFISSKGSSTSTNSYHLHRNSNTLYLYRRNTSNSQFLLFQSTTIFSADIYDFLVQRLSSTGKFPLIGNDIEYPANTFAVFYRVTGTKKWNLVPVSSGTNPITESTYTESKYMVLDLDAGDSIAEIKHFEGVEQ